MAVHNRTLGGTEQNKVLDFNVPIAIVNGQTGLLAYVPFPCTIQAAQLAAFGVTASPNLQITVSRFIAGAGSSTWNLSSTFVPPSFGSSGVLASGISLPATGSTLLLLMPNDVIGYLAGGGASGGVFGCIGGFVVRPIQDVRVYLAGLAV